ncbi:rhodanese-like domain-containing protein [Novosphingobium rosa]|uniref:rhodanese-like domain-containing protein n=1 Tax=Novosphingobium rosa TaxID=76978 RepID=UPI00082DBCC4|nr:rhodanese-like domain-containing protein [Novosphingobium rosa]
MKRRTMLAGAMLLAPGLLHAAPPDVAASEALFSADGYRVSHYRGPVPTPPAGVQRITVREVAHMQDRALLIDVLPAQGGHRDEDGTWHLAVPRPSIPGAHWFPEVGRGDLPPTIGHWFEQGVARLVAGDRHRMIVTFCLADCWMSWNAARRLHALGYRNVRWLAEGTDGWRELGLPLVDATPERN